MVCPRAWVLPVLLLWAVRGACAPGCVPVEVSVRGVRLAPPAVRFAAPARLPAVHRRWSVVLGAYESALVRRVVLAFEARCAGARCVLCLSAVEVEAGFVVGQILLHAALARDRCLAAQVLAHERRHVADVERIDRRYRAVVDRALRGAFAGAHPRVVAAGGLEDAKALYLRDVERVIDPFAVLAERALDRGSARIDSPAARRGENAAARAQCGRTFGAFAARLGASGKAR